MDVVLTWIFGTLTTLLGGLNIYQLLTFRAYKKKATMEADRSEIDNLKSIIASMREEISRLEVRVENAERRADENGQKYYTLQAEFESYKSNHK